MTPGSKLGPYEIVSRLGEGGMGEVFKANDTRLGRTVAIKVLKDQFTERFEKEARAVATLNHPNICAIYDVGPNYLVLEYLEGKPLSVPQPLKDLLKIGAEVASALEAAHRKGLVHCDLKPGNILITPSGAKVLDFGLARRTRREPGPNDATLTAGNIGMGTIEGTLPYMAPEQIEARDVDRRTDIFALGAVLYEMATGVRAFPGESQSSIIASVLHTEPEQASKRKSGLPQHLDRIISRCLAKDPEDRWQSARDIALELKTVSEEKPLRKSTNWLPIAAAAILAATAAYFLRPQTKPELIRLSVPPPIDGAYSAFGSAISPDGKYVASSVAINGQSMIYLRAFDAPEAVAIPGSEDGQFPFWSPDSASVGFNTPTAIKRFDVGRPGVHTVLGDPTNMRGASWNKDGVLVYSSNRSAPLRIVRGPNQRPATLTNFDQQRGDRRHILPQFLPDGRHVLFFLAAADAAKSGSYVASIDDPGRAEPVKELLGSQAQAVFASAADSGKPFLLFRREETIYAQSFDLQTFQLTGSATPLFNRSSGVNTATPGFLNLSASANGRLLDGGVHEAKNTLGWLDQTGSAAGAVFPAADYVVPRVSPDESKIVVSQVDPASGNFDIWVLENPGDRPRRLTSSPGLDYYPAWAPDGKSIYYASEQLSHAAIFQVPLDASSQPRLVFAKPSLNMYPFDVSLDGKYMLATSVATTDPGSIWLIPLAGGEARPLIATPSAEHHGHFSKGANAGRWMVYSSNESGNFQVYVRRFMGDGVSDAKWQVSTVRGLNPKWKADESGIYFLGPNNRMMLAPVRINGETIDIGQPRELFDSKFMPVPVNRYSYDLGAKSGRLLLLQPQPAKRAAGMDLIMNWTLLLNRPTQ